MPKTYDSQFMDGMYRNVQNEIFIDLILKQMLFHRLNQIEWDEL